MEVAWVHLFFLPKKAHKVDFKKRQISLEFISGFLWSLNIHVNLVDGDNNINVITVTLDDPGVQDLS